MPPPFCPPTMATAIHRTSHPPTVPYLKHTLCSNLMSATEVPVNYMDATSRFVCGDAALPPPPPLSDKYSTPLYLDATAAALRSNYSRQSTSTSTSAAGKEAIYRRAAQLQAGQMSYYPGRDEWLKKWGNERRYGLPKPCMHDTYTDFIKGDRNREWVQGENENATKKKMNDKIEYG